MPMASAEALDTLLSDKAAWTAYVARTPGVIDLTFADLSGKDLNGRRLARCDFSGTQLERANLDNTLIHACTFIGANLSKASFVHCEMRKVKARKVIAADMVVRESTLAGVELTESNMSAAIIATSSLTNCRLTRIHGSELVLSTSKFDKCALIELSFDGMRMSGCEFDYSTLIEWTITDIEVMQTRIHASQIAKIRTKSGSLRGSRLTSCSIEVLAREEPGRLCHGIDLSRSTLTDTDLRIVGLDSATMLETALIRCDWPRQRGRISLTGRYIPSEHLLSQPVQDLKGVLPLTRREIADAQYIVRKIATSSTAARLGIRLWGLCTGFGQSIGRLSLMTLGVIVASTISILGVRGQLIGRYLHPELLYRAVDDSFNAFFSLATLPVSGTSGELVVLILTRISGFLVLGFWVTIAASKLSRLGAE